ncbi:aminoacylase-1-like [Physella acuta]|uniref:aminoacylase-1-like n=1 Tax=Physella acuta TaxID=109671 RepID=UPI0027DCB85B|nr:aminoacylase-1-like [Physella acuta]
MEDQSVHRFREYLRINTMHPTPDYDAALQFLKQQATEIGLDFKILDSGVTGKPLGLMTWKGQQPELKSVLLTSHMDVVPVFPEKWTHEPFSADKDEKGNIYARGAQDMKCVTSWYLEAIRNLKAQGKTFARTIYLLFTSEEEIGSKPAQVFSTSKQFQDLNIEFGLDEGIANPGEKMRVFYGERSIWWIKVLCKGSPGHGLAFIENTAAKKLQYIMNKFLGLRDEQEKKFKEDPSKGLGAFTTVNMTMLEGGVQPNVVPAELSATFDVRIPPTTDFSAFKEKVLQWCKEAGPDVSIEMLHEGQMTEMVDVSDANPWFVAFKKACERANVDLETEIFPGGTDSRHFRKAGVNMLGFSPMNNTPILLHDNDEFLNEKVFLRGIKIYEEIIPALADLVF